MPVLLNLEKVTLVKRVVCACACNTTFCETNWKMKFKSYLILKMILAIKIRSLLTYVLTCHVPTCLAFLLAHVPTCQRALRAYVPTCLVCLRAHVPCMPCVLTCSHAVRA